MRVLDEAVPTARAHPSESWRDGEKISVRESIAEEVPVALVYNGISHAVMLATPGDLEDFGIGFSLSEGIVDALSDIRDLDVMTVERGITVEMTIASGQFARLKERRRNLAGRTGCGLCGTESLDYVLRPLPCVASTFSLNAQALHDAAGLLANRQPLRALTGATHAAAWGRADGSLALVREDVGRHNALDKLIGAMAKAHVDFADGFALLTSRASSEMVQKAATLGIPLVAAISAPTGLAIEVAQRSGVTLVAFVRDRRLAVFANGERLVESRIGVPV